MDLVLRGALVPKHLTIQNWAHPTYEESLDLKWGQPTCDDSHPTRFLANQTLRKPWKSKTRN